MEIGNSSSTVAWEPDPKTGYDAELLGWYRSYTRLHLRLFPYAWTYAENLLHDGRPLQRPLGLAYPELGQHPSDEYLFGDSLLVAPVIERGAVSRSVIFPPGRWIDWWSGEVHDGANPAAVTVAAPLGVLPLFLAEGGSFPCSAPRLTRSPRSLIPPRSTPTRRRRGAVGAPRARRKVLVHGLRWCGDRPGEAGEKISLSSADGAELKYGVVFEVVALGGKPTAVTEGGKALSEVADVKALEAAASASPTWRTRGHAAGQGPGGPARRGDHAALSSWRVEGSRRRARLRSESRGGV